MYRYNMIMRIQQSKSYRRVFKIDLTKPIMDDLKNIANPNHLFTMNTIINLSGLSGTGKSESMISLSKEIFDDFSYKNVFFFDQQILDNVHSFPENTMLIRDENPQKAVFGLGSTRTSTQINVLAETCRASGLNLAFIEPSFIQADISKLILETVDMDIYNRVTRLAVRDTRSLQYMGAMYVKILPQSDPDIKGYLNMKNIFIENMRLGKMAGAKSDTRKIAQDILDEINPEIYRTKKEVKAFIINKFPSYTSGEIDLIATNIIILKKEQYGN